MTSPIQKEIFLQDAPLNNSFILEKEIPNEILFEILDKLPLFNLSQSICCKRFKLFWREKLIRILNEHGPENISSKLTQGKFLEILTKNEIDLNCLKLGNWKIDNAGLKKIIAHCPNLKELQIKFYDLRNEIGEEEGEEGRSVNLSEFLDFIGENVENPLLLISQLQHLEKLHLSGDNFNNLEALQQFKNLKTLYFKDYHFKNNDFEILKKLSNLEVLT